MAFELSFPGNELAGERKGQEVNWPGSYRTIRSRDWTGLGAKRLGAVKTLRTQDSAEVSRGHIGTGTELFRPPANIFATIGHTEERFNNYSLVVLLKMTTDF